MKDIWVVLEGNDKQILWSEALLAFVNCASMCLYFHLTEVYVVYVEVLYVRVCSHMTHACMHYRALMNA